MYIDKCDKIKQTTGIDTQYIDKNGINNHSAVTMNGKLLTPNAFRYRPNIAK